MGWTGFPDSKCTAARINAETNRVPLVAGHAAVDVEEVRVRHWTKPTMATVLLVDRSGSMSGDRLATAAVAAAACSWRAPSDWSVLAFADRQLALQSQDDARAPAAVVGDLLRLRGQGTTDLDGIDLSGRE